MILRFGAVDYRVRAWVSVCYVTSHAGDHTRSPQNPQLLDARIRVKCGDEVIDEFHSCTAMRSVTISRDRFMLDGRLYILRLVLD